MFSPFAAPAARTLGFEIQLSVIAARVDASHLVLMSAFISRGIRSEEK